MISKCEKCGADFEVDENSLKNGEMPERCPKCELDAAVSQEIMSAASPPPQRTRTFFQKVFYYNYFSLLKKPVVIIAAIIAGVLYGLYYQKTAVLLAPVGDIYLSLLKMCVFPILITAIITSVGKLFVTKEASTYIVRILIVFILMLSLTGIVGITTGYIGKPGKGLSKEAQVTLGKMLNESDKKAMQPVDLETREMEILAFVKSMIPENIFNSLNLGSSLQILFFSLILGVATGFLPEIEGRLIISFSESLFKAFFAIINWILYLLPIALFCLLASQIANTGVDILVAMTKFVIMVYAAALVIMLISSLIIWYSTGIGVFRSIAKLKDCLLIGFGTQSTFASMPSQLDGLKSLNVNPELSNLVVPIGGVICRFSMVITYSMATIFTAQLYGVELGTGAIFTALFLSVLAAVAGAGTPGIVSIAMISIVLGPLGLPSAAIIVLLLAINPVIEPITTMANVHSIVAATSLIGKGVQSETPAAESYPADWDAYDQAAPAARTSI